VNVQAGAGDVLGVLIFSALPFVSVQALADSDLGKKLQVCEVLFMHNVSNSRGGF
jgi:hypothetical protein